MKEKLYTIPLNDAMNADDECPFCFIERKLEQDLLDFTLGSGSSYMENDIREQTDKAGFCRYHFEKMLQAKFYVFLDSTSRLNYQAHSYISHISFAPYFQA